MRTITLIKLSNFRKKRNTHCTPLPGFSIALRGGGIPTPQWGDQKFFTRWWELEK